MTPESVARLEEWMIAKEGEHQEFKEAKNNFHFDELVKYACAIANEGGGRVIFGVSDSRPRRVVGSQAFEQPERTRKGLCDRIPLAIDFEEIAHPNGRVLVFHIPARPIGIPIKDKGIYWSRKEDSLVPMSEERLRRAFAESGHDFSADFCDQATVADLEPLAIEDFRNRWVSKARLAGDEPLAAQLRSLSHEELLNDIEAVANGRVTYAALILFGTAKALRRNLAQAEVIFEYRSSEASGPAQDRVEYRRGFFLFYDELWNKINTRNDRQSFQDGLFVLAIPTFNERSVRETILNCISHRDYQMEGSIFLRQFARRLEIDSPGGLPYGITLENILDRQKPRNRLIAEIFMRCGLVERSGQGMNLIFEETIRQGKPIPDFPRTDPWQVGMTLFGEIRNPDFLRFVEKVGRETTTVFSLRDWLVFDLIERDQKIPKELVAYATRLQDLGLIEKAGRSKFMLARRYYVLTGDKAKYTRKKGLDREHNLALLLKHIQDNADTGTKLDELCQVLPSLPTSTIRSLVQTLKLRGEIHSSGKTSSGRWFPGAS